MEYLRPGALDSNVTPAVDWTHFEDGLTEETEVGGLRDVHEQTGG